MPRPLIVVMVGLPGSGKSTWLRNQGLPALSSDSVRHLLSDNEDNQNINRLVFRTLRYLLAQRLRAGVMVTYIDSTALAPWERRCWIQFAQLHECDVEALFFDTPLEVCLERNAKRARVVPPDVIRSMTKRLVSPATTEGFSQVRVIRWPEEPA